MEYKRYDSLVIGSVLCLLLAIASFTYRIDPGNIFRNVLLETCGKLLLEGHDVAITQNYDERLLQKYLIEHDANNYDVLVFGSSRTMDIGKRLFPQRTVKNYSVSGASIEDDIALYFLYERLHGTPQKVIIGGDAWLLNANSGQNRWKSLVKEYKYGKERMEKNGRIGVDTKSFDLEKYEQLISWPYLNESINKFKKEGLSNAKHGYCLADDKVTVDKKAGVICPDGTHIPSFEEQTRDAEQLARQYISKVVYSLEKYEELDNTLQASVKEFFWYLKAQDIEIVLYLTPYHPVVYPFLIQNEKYYNVVKAEEFFRDVAKEYGLKVAGSYDPDQCGLSNADFLDGMHLRRESVERILRGKL